MLQRIQRNHRWCGQSQGDHRWKENTVTRNQ
uniref:S-adenosylmethionine decarboxylase proenzyme n=1 Tax=Rhizophora mucronata TaxID=61149 RepID=A0A2P2PNH1_RHIMU